MEPIFNDYRFISGKLSVEWEWIGEGNSGDFNDDDPEDRRLLRANLQIMGPDGEWHQPDSASYCTLAETTTPKQLLDDASYALIQIVNQNGGVQFDQDAGEPFFSCRKAMEHWTWTEFDVENDRIVIPRDNSYFKLYKYIRER